MTKNTNLKWKIEIPKHNLDIMSLGMVNIDESSIAYLLYYNDIYTDIFIYHDKYSDFLSNTYWRLRIMNEEGHYSNDLNNLKDIAFSKAEYILNIK